MWRAIILLGIAALALIVGAATATPPAQIAGSFLARGSTDETFSINVPRVVQSTKTIRVRRGGKLVSRKIKVRRTVAEALIACGPSRRCDVVVQSILFQPGGSTGWHSHPGALAVAVKAGAVTRYEASCEKQTYPAGQAFLEKGPHHVILVRNEGLDPAEVLVTYFVPAGTENPALRIDKPAPSGCAGIG